MVNTYMKVGVTIPVTINSIPMIVITINSILIIAVMQVFAVEIGA